MGEAVQEDERRLGRSFDATAQREAKGFAWTYIDAK